MANFDTKEQIQNLALFWEGPKSVVSGNLSNNGHVWATQWPTSSELKIKFDPSFDRSWCEFFKIIKDDGPKSPPLGCNLGPQSWSLSRQISDPRSAQ